MKKLVIITWIVLVLSLMVINPVQADVDVIVDPSTIVINAVQDKSESSTTFHIIPNIEGLTKIRISTLGLTNETDQNNNQPTLQANQVAFTPAEFTDLPVGERQAVQVNISGITGYGDWVGEVNISWSGETAGEMVVPIEVHMATVPVLELESPDEVVVSGTRSQTKVDFQVTLHETEGGSPAPGVVAFIQSLYNADQSAAFPSTGIEVDLEDEIASNGRTEMGITFDLSEAKKSGSYSGNLIVQSENAADVLIPIKVNIKDPFILPFIFMVLGVIVSGILNYYRTYVLAKDKVGARIEKLEEHNDDDFKTYCDYKLKEQIGLAEDYLKKENTVEANNAVNAAEKLWDNWDRHRDILLAYIGIINTLSSEIEKYPPDFQNLTSVESLRDTLENIKNHQIPDYVDKPQKLEEKIKDKNTGLKPILNSLLVVYKSQKTLEDSLGKANVSDDSAIDVDKLTELRANLIKIDEKFRAINQLPTVPELSEIQANLVELRIEINKSYMSGIELKNDYTILFKRVNDCLNLLETTDKNLKKAIDYVKTYCLEVAENKTKNYHWKDAKDWIMKSWRGARACFFLFRSIEEIRQGETGEKWKAVINAEMDMVNWLINSENYNNPPELFFNAIKEKAVNLRDAISSATKIAFDLDWEGKRKLKGRLRTESFGEGRIRYTAAFIEELDGIAEREEIPVSVITTKLTIFNRVWWTAKRRLVIYYIVTISVGVVLLTIVGLKTLYFDVPDFGANSFWDYLKVMLWGFGAEASSSEVSGLIKEWGLPLAGGKQS